MVQRRHIKRWFFYGINKLSITIISALAVMVLLDIFCIKSENIGIGSGFLLVGFRLLFATKFKTIDKKLEQVLENGYVCLVLFAIAVFMVLHTLGIIKWKLKINRSKIFGHDTYQPS